LEGVEAGSDEGISHTVPQPDTIRDKALSLRKRPYSCPLLRPQYQSCPLPILSFNLTP